MTRHPIGRPAAPAPGAPDDELRRSHQHSLYNRDQVADSEICGCFFCLRMFRPREITAWGDDNETAICPHCGMDSVLPANSCKVEAAFLRLMQARYFANGG